MLLKHSFMLQRQSEKHQKPLALAFSFLVLFGMDLSVRLSRFHSIWIILDDWEWTTLLCQEDWNIVLFAGMERTSHWAALYFVLLMTFGNYILFNLLVAILVEGFSKQDELFDKNASKVRPDIWILNTLATTVLQREGDEELGGLNVDNLSAQSPDNVDVCTKSNDMKGKDVQRTYSRDEQTSSSV